MSVNKHYWLAACYWLCGSVCLFCSVVQAILLFVFCRCLLEESGFCRRLTNAMGCFVFGIVASTIFLITLVHQLHCLFAYMTFYICYFLFRIPSGTWPNLERFSYKYTSETEAKVVVLLVVVAAAAVSISCVFVWWLWGAVHCNWWDNSQ